jgi:virulence-associated protein VapD
MASQKRYKAINFDIDTASLIKEFGEKNRRGGYARIQRFMLRNGFEHKQWSGYISTKPLSYAEVYVMIDDLLIACPWLPKCVRKFDITDVMAESDAYIYISTSDTAKDGQLTIDDDVF